MELSPLINRSITLTLGDTLDAESATPFRNLVREALDAKPETLNIDMHNLTYIDSTGLGLLTLARGEAERIACTVKLTQLPPGHPRKVLELMKFDLLFSIGYIQG